MILSIASGKGGTGKTTIATGLAHTLWQHGQVVAYLDADAEEPNGHIFLKPEIIKETAVTIPIPQVDHETCTLCGECVDICEANAIEILGKKVVVFPSLCSGCGGCYHVCPVDAISETPRTIGQIRSGIGSGVDFFEGRLTIGEAEAPPVIDALRKVKTPADTVIIDAPPGTSCPVISAVNNTDFILLVTEPTPFGLNDLKLAVDMVREISLPFGVAINRSDMGDNRVEAFCKKEKIDVLLRIPFDRKIAEAYSRGELISCVDSRYGNMLYSCYTTILDRVSHERTRSY